MVSAALDEVKEKSGVQRNILQKENSRQKKYRLRENLEEGRPRIGTYAAEPNRKTWKHKKRRGS